MALLTNINDLFTVDSTGAISFNRVSGSTTTGYTFPATDGTDGYVLKTNGDGVLDWAPDSNTGTVTGTGVANKVAYWTSATNIDDGPITFATNDSTFAGDVYILKTLNSAVTSKVTNLNAGSSSQARFVAVSDGGNIQLKSVSIANTTYGAGDAGVINCDTMSGGLMFAHNDQVKYTLAFDGSNTWTGGGTFGGSVDINGELTVSPNTAGKDTFTLTTNASNDGRLLIKSDTTTKVDIQANGDSYFNGGNVGIGTDSPSSRLTVNKTKSGTDVENYDLIRLGLLGTGAVGDSSTIGWFSTGGTKTAGIEGISGLDNILYGELAFHVRRYTTDAYDEVMRINNRGNVGIGTGSASPIEKLQVVGQVISTGSNSTSATAGAERAIMDLSGFSATDHSARFGHFRGTNSAGAGQLRLYTDSVERVRIDADGNVGIGTSSPTTITGYTILEINNSTNGGILDLSQNDVMRGRLVGTSTSFSVETSGSIPMYFFVAGDNRMVINGTTGNVGIGTTLPQSILSLSKTDEASYTPATAIDYSLMLGTRNGNAAGTSDDLGPGIVWKYNDSGGTYTKKSAGIMQVGEGNYLRSGLAFYTNNNANTTSVWSEKMRLSMDGNVGIGITAPVPKLHLAYSGGSYGTDATSGFINQADTGRATQRIRSITDNAAELFFDVNGGIRWDISARGSSSSHALHFYPQAPTPVYNNVAAHTFQLSQNGDVIVTGAGSSGRFGIGTDVPSASLDVRGASAANLGVAFFLESSTTAYLTTSFNSRPTHTLYGINTTNTYVGTRLSHAGNTEFFHGIVKGANNGETKYVFQGYNGNAYQEFGYIDCYTTGAGSLVMSGDVVAYSDKKLKKNIKTLDGSKVYKMRGVSFDRIDTGKKSSGVIAQEIQEVAPELVNKSGDTLGVAYGNISGYLIEAIKELKAEIEELKSNKCNCNK